MSENKENKYFHCHSCRHVWKTTDYLTAGDVCVSECPICEKTDDVKETTWRVANLALGWDKATGPVTEEGKARVSLNGWKYGGTATKFRLMAPAKPGKYGICEDCEVREECESKPYSYCPMDLETVARFVHAYKEGKVNDLRELAGLTQAQTYKVFSNMIAHVLNKGVMLQAKKPVLDKDGRQVRDDEGNPLFIEWEEKNQLLKEIPAYIDRMGFSAEMQDMTPKTRQESETLKGFIDDSKTKQEDLVAFKKAQHEEMKRMREALENMKAVNALKNFEEERKQHEQTADTTGESS